MGVELLSYSVTARHVGLIRTNYLDLRGACVALARKLAGILYAMLRDGTEFDPQALRRGVAETPAAV